MPKFSKLKNPLRTFIVLLDRVPVRFRLSLGHSTLMAGLYLAIGFSVYKLVERNLIDSVDAALLASAQFIRDTKELSASSSIDSMLSRFFSDPGDRLIDDRQIRPFAQILHISGKIQSKTENIRVSLPITPRAVYRAEKGLVTFETFHIENAPPLRQITMPVMHQGRFESEIVQVGTTLQEHWSTLQNLALLLWFILPATLTISIFFGYFLTARALKPVKAITLAATKMGIDELSLRLPISRAKDEIQDLAKTFNRLLERLEDAVNRLRRFSSDVSHELRTPLAVLRGEAELALRRDREKGEYVDALGNIRKEALSMTGIIEDLLLLAKADSKAILLNPGLVSLGDLCADLKNKCEKVYADKQITLRTQFINIAENADIYCCRNYLSIALQNVLFNAAKHSPQASHVDFTVEKTASGMEFRIKDYGEGIKKEHLPYIFDPFFRADTVRNRALGGVGIGLSLAQALVKLHDGKISVHSEETMGANFVISIPDRKWC